jgi:hypothetical protein
MSHLISRPRVIICLLFLMSLLPSAFIPGASAQGAGSPVLSITSAVARPSTLLTVQGDGFSPGGLVHLVITDPVLATIRTDRWIVASTPQYGTNGSQDPVQGYVPAGSVIEVIDLFPAAMYGTNGSQDPARGYVSGSESAALGAGCGEDLVIWAYDLSTKTWSSPFAFRSTC